MTGKLLTEGSHPLGAVRLGQDLAGEFLRGDRVGSLVMLVPLEGLAPIQAAPMAAEGNSLERSKLHLFFGDPNLDLLSLVGAGHAVAIAQHLDQKRGKICNVFVEKASRGCIYNIYDYDFSN